MKRLPMAPAPVDYRLPWEPACVICHRPRSRHGTPVVVGEETIVPVCELLHPGGMCPEGPAPPPGPRPLARRLALARSMRPQEAHAIAGNLGEPSKMPGASYGLDAWQCRTGSELGKDPTSMCHEKHCYAKRNFYRYYYPALKARARRMKAITHPLWPEAMIVLCWEYMADVRRAARLERRPAPEVYWFRWHDSGDLMSLDHLENICAVAEVVPTMKFWLPTREYGIVAQLLAEGRTPIPPNLCVRLSAFRVGELAAPPTALAMLPRSTVHADAPLGVPGQRRPFECHAYKRENRCGGCRACWTPTIPNVSYPIH